jgi:hypothetical protein
MIRADRFALDVDTFAAERRRILERSDARFLDAVRASLTRLGLPGWDDNIVEMALDIFDETAREEIDEWNPIIDDMRDEFQRELRETLAKTKAVDADKFDAQVERMVRWLSTYSVNAGTEAATTSDPDGAVGLEWVTMGDSEVRALHVETNGEIVPSGLPFTVGEYELLYPGQPVGPPEVWINCRCVARPYLIEEFKVKTTEFTADPQLSVDQQLPNSQDSQDSPGFTSVTAAAEEVPQTFGAGVIVEEAEEEDDAPPIDEEDFAPVPWHGVLAPEGTPSGDGRQFDVDGLTHRDLPLPLKAMFVDDEGHKGSVIVGRIDNIFRENGLVKGEGVFDSSEAAYETVRMLAEGMWRGVSVDVDDMQAQLSEDGSVSSATGRICAATICAIPAFAEAFVGLGTWADEEQAASQPHPEAEAEDDFAVSRETFVSEGSWDGSAGRFTPEQWKRSCIMHVCDGEEKSCHKLPIREPGGALSRAGVHAAAGRIGQANGTPEQIAAAKAKLRGAYKELGEEPPESLTAAGGEDTFDIVPIRTKDGPGWITDPHPTHRITAYWVDGRGALKIKWGVPGDFNRCRRHLAKYVQNPKWLAGLCANLHFRALHVWPGREGGGGHGHHHTGETMELTAAATGTMLPGGYFKNPELVGPTPFTVTEDGRVYGHVATWDTCHVGLPIGDGEGECTTAPHSETNYAFFLTGEVQTDLGPVAVGQITMGGGHASAHAGLRAAISHYDSTSTAVADVTAGEDEHGIWVAGVLRPNVTEEQVHELRAAAISGDWRKVKTGTGDLEMIAALAVNVPGFPIPRPSMLVASSGERLALVAAAIPLAAGQDAGDNIEIPTSPLEKFNAARAKFRALDIARAKSVFANAE